MLGNRKLEKTVIRKAIWKAIKSNGDLEKTDLKMQRETFDTDVGSFL